jgi:hypothetical protein
MNMDKEPFSLGSILRNVVAQERAEVMKTSPQLTLGELILKVQAISSKEKPVVFDFDEKLTPERGSCWRGSYCELAINFRSGEPIDGAAFLKMLEDEIGATHKGYKGGDFTMGKTTPVWAAEDYGTSYIPGYKGSSEYISAGIVNVKETAEKIIIETTPIDY